MWTITYQNTNKDLKNVVAHKIVFLYKLDRWKRAVVNR